MWLWPLTDDLESQQGSRGCRGTRACKISSSWVQRFISYLLTEKNSDESNTVRRYGADSKNQQTCTRDAREWLFTFPLPPIPVQSIPIPSHSHSRTLHRCSINYFGAREDWSLNMPLKLTISCVHFYSTQTRKIVVENITSFDLWFA